LKPLAEFKLPDWGTSVAFSPDGKTLAIGTYEIVQLVDVAAAKATETIRVQSGFTRGVAWSPDGTLLATGSYKAVQIWKAADRSPVRSMKTRGYANDVKFSPDGSLLVAAVENGTVMGWAVADGSEKLNLKGPGDPTTAVAFSPDGSLIAAAFGDETRLTRAGAVRVWKTADSSPAASPEIMPEKCATDVAFSTDGLTLLVADMNEHVTLYDVSTGTAKGFFGKHGRPVNSVVPLKDGLKVLSGAGGRFKDGNNVKLWTITEGEELAEIEHHTGKVTRIAVSPDESRLATVSFDKTAALWDLKAILSAPPPTPALADAGGIPGLEGLIPPALAQMLQAELQKAQEERVLKIGIIGLDTSHATEFTKIINGAKNEKPLAGCKVVAAYPKGSPDIESSVSRVPEYTEIVKKLDVEIVDSIDDLLTKVDCVLLETNDGRPHLEQAIPVLKAHKPVFVDKPVAGSLVDVIAIYQAAEQLGTPVFSSSSIRYAAGPQAARRGDLGKIYGCDSFSPCHLEATHPDIYWYGIHGVEGLFTVMGTGCQSVSRTSSADFDVAVGTWSEGRIGTFRGIRKGGSGYGGTVFGEKAAQPLVVDPGYPPLVKEICTFFQTGKAPVSADETIEIYAFMTAADESKRLGGAPVTLESVLGPAREQAKAILVERLTK
jgi:predicted dehydrogenase